MIDGPTRALRSRSPELLRADLARLVVDGQAQWLADRRDLVVALAPYHDCATRLGLDPKAEFAAVAVVDGNDGPRYEWT